MNSLAVPVAWDAMQGVHVYAVAEMPPDEVLVSDTMIERQLRIYQPLALMAHFAVSAGASRSHDEDEARYHRNRPAQKTCPFDPGCRFVFGDDDR